MNICQNLSFESRLSKVSLLSKLSKQCFVFGHFWLFSQNNQPTLDWKFKNDWTKRLQKIPRKINVSLSLAKRKLAEKNEWNLFNQSGEVTHASIYLTNCKRNHLSVVYDKIPVFYALKYPKFTTITFYPSAWRPNPLLTLPNCTNSSWPHAHFNDIFTHVTVSGTNMKVSRVKQPI